MDDQDAEDVAQAALVVLLKRAADVPQPAAYEFLRSTVWRCAASARRKRREMPCGPSAAANVVDGAPSPEDTLASAEVSQAVRAAVARMPESRRFVVEVLGDGRTIADVAREQATPESTVGDRVDAAREKLRADLERQRAAERRKSGHTSWLLLPFMDVRATLKRLALLGTTAAAVAGGASLHSPSLGPTAIEMPARVVEVDTVRPVVAAMAERSVERAAPVRLRARHDAGARMLAERLRRPE